MALTAPAVEGVKIQARELKERLDRGEAFTILDVRGPEQVAESGEKIRGAVHIDPFHFRIDPAWPKDRPTVLYCA